MVGISIENRLGTVDGRVEFFKATGHLTSLRAYSYLAFRAFVWITWHRTLILFTTKDTKSTKFKNKISETFVSFVIFVVNTPSH